ncbi:MAG: hypothetical protein LBV68_07685, partial [Spirochaetaceae bacterium]|nr:hypothetical protein [Spirochaetaceae bacterium]
ILELYNALIIQAASGEKERAWVNLENRKSAIRLLSAPSTSRWFFDEINYVPDDEDMVAFYNNGLEKQLREYYLALSEEYNNMYDSYADLALSPEIIKLQLSEYDIQIKRALGLIEVYNKCKEGSKAVIEEINLIAKKELHDFFIGIGIQTGNTYLPDIETITEVLTQDKDTFIINAVRFIYRLNDIFNRSSFSISVEISEWLNLFIDYISDTAVLYGVSTNINEEEIIAIINENNILLESYPDDAMELMQINNFLFIEYQVISLIKNKFNYYNEDLPDKKNWREYLDSDFLLKFRENNPALVFNMSWSSFIQSNMADTVEQLNLKTNMINDWLKKESRLNSLEDYTVFLEKIENYMNETDTNREYSCVIDHSLYNDLDNSAGLIRSMTDKRRLLNEEFAQLGISYELAKASRENIKIQIEVLSEEIKAAKNEYDAELLSYSAAANEFERRGNVYQTIYSQTKKQSDNLEEKRFEYEKQDTIQRWASTAYLSNSYDYGVDRAEYKNPAQELLYSKERYDRSEIILAALKDLYDNGEKYRKYEDSEYQRIYNEYKEIFERLIFSIKIKDVLENEIKKESLKNTELYLDYKDFFESLSSDFIVRQDDVSEQAVLIKELLSVISVDALGNLSFKRDNGSISKRSGNETDKLLEYFSLPMTERQGMENSPAYSGEMIRLLNYFALEEKRGVETHESAEFESATRKLVRYLSETLSNVEKYKQWSLARDYLVLEAARSTDSPLLKQAVYHPDNSLQEGIFSTMPAKYIFFEFSEIKEVTYKAESLENIQRDAYNSLGEEEKRALEFYTILTLAGGGGKASRSFTYASKFVEFEYLYNLVDSEARAAADKRRACLAAAFFIFFIDPHMIALSVLYNNAEKQLNATKNQLTSPLNESKDIIFGGAVSLLSESNSLLGFFDQYYRSSERLAKLRGECADDTELQWQDIQLSLESTGTINNTDILKIKTYWEDFQRVNKTRCESVPDALAKIIAWSRIERKVQLASLEEKWAADELSRLENQKTYRDLSDAYIENESGYEELSSMLDLTYGSRASAQKNHILTLGNTIMDNLYGIIGKGEGYTQDRIDMAVEYVNTINRAYQERLNAELTEREIEWEQQRIGLYKKYEAWKESAGLILEYGRLDWKNSGEIMALRYNNWKKAFNEEYAQIGEEWDAAYLQGLQDKEQWLEEVNRAVNNASVNALLALIGANAEQKARVLDTRDPFGVFPLDALPESGRVLSEILNSAGISNTENAFNALNAITGTISTQTKSGTGSVYVWDSGIIQAQAQRLAKKANDDLAERQSKMLSANVRRIADQIKSGILANIQNANNNFRESMDNMFIFEGQWSRSGRNYIKDVIVHSTLSDPVITERVFVEGYRDFALSAAGLSLDLETDISDERLNGLSSFAINAIIQEIQDEIKTKTVKIFGNDTLVKGAFHVWTGDSPVLIENPSHKNSMEDNFQNQGSGELGRLRRHYIHWSIKETNGIGLLNTAAWDKPMWDSRDSWFDAPSFRTVNEIGAAIAATVVTSVVTFGTMAPVAALLCTAAISAAIATADDFLFAVADGIGGYKDWDEAFFDYGQAFAISSASSLISAGFSGMGSALGTSTQAGVNAAGTAAGTSVTSSLGNSMAHTLINGAQTLASSTVTSALDAVSYRNGQWGFSKEVFRNGAFNGLKSLAGSMPGTFVKSTLNSGLNGFVNDLFKDGTKLSDLVGGISTQSINYALGGDFTVNLLNLGLFTDNALSSGL